MSIHRYTQYMYSYPHKTAYGPLNGVRLSDFLTHLSGPGHSLYLHLPFCETKCGYCNLFSVTGQNHEAIERYLDGLERQILQYEPLFASVDCEFSDFTIGGGTPLLLTDSQLERTFSLIQNHLRLSSNAEIIIETAPNQTTPEKLSLLKNAGVTRVSMGIQSFFDEELRALKRSHRADKARRALSLLMESGFPCVNADFIYGVPGQSVDSFLASIREAVSFGPEELFLYPLYLKHGAILERKLGEGIVLDEEMAFRQYTEAAAFLKSSGYRQDSMRRFVKIDSAGANREFSDCGFGNTISLGCGGRSYLGNLHFCTPYTITREGCLEQIRQYEETNDYCEISHGFLLSPDEQKRRYAIRHLLILPGLCRETYQELFHSDIYEDFPLLKEWLADGYLQESGAENARHSSGAWISLTETGLGLSDYLGPQLISNDVRKKMEHWEEVYGTRNNSVSGKLKKL